jgi:outer membrane lipoprotein carrier protein
MKLGLALFVAVNFLFVPASDSLSETASLVKQFERTYRSSKTLRAHFLERYFDNGKEVRSEAGIAYFARPGKMRWEYVSPEPNLYVVDGKWSWFYVPADHTATRVRAKESADSRTPFALLAGEMKVSRICKSISADTSSPAVDARAVVLRCNLRDGDESVPMRTPAQKAASSLHGAYVLFELNPASAELLRVRVIDPGGVQVEFQFANWEFDPRVDESKFHFFPPKGVTIVNGDFSGSSAATVSGGAPQQQH